MTRRLAIAILLTVWAMLIAGGIIAYAVTRSLLVDYFDESLFAYASSVPGLIHANGQTPALTSLGGDRFLVVDDLNRTVTRPADPPAGVEPQLISAKFSDAEGQHVRTIQVRAFAKPANPSDAPRPVTVVYTRSAAAFDSRMNHLATAFALFGAAAGLITAWVARQVSRAALRPLSDTAARIASIDERQLDRRLDPTTLPPELAPVANRLNEMLARLQTAFAARQRFLADASHELRTPVAALVTGMEVTLRHPRDAAVYQGALETYLGDARQLRLLVERLMEQVRSEHLAHDEPRQEIDLAGLLNQCADNIAELAKVKDLELCRDIPEGVRCDTAPGRLRSIVVNLLSNAVEYSFPHGKVLLACRAVAGEGIELRVEDAGPGIAAEHLPHLFEPFFRADKSRQNDSGHLGLGLSLVQAHLQALHGTCRVESKLGKGTVFRVMLPGLTMDALHDTEDRESRGVATSHARLIQAP